MKKIFTDIKKALICFTAIAASASMLTPAAVFAAEVSSEVSIENHTEGRDNIKTVSGITIGDVEAPREGFRLDDKAVVATAEKESWEIPVIWIGEDLLPDTGLAGKGTYLPVLAYIVPENYAVLSETGNEAGYTVTLEDDLLKLFGGSQIISIYEAKTGITYILPAGLKDLFAQKSAPPNPRDDGGNEIIPADQVAPPVTKPQPAEETEQAEEEEEEEKEQEEEQADTEEEDLSHLVSVHCDENAKEALSKEDLEFLADLVVNKLQPQAVNLLLESFPAFKEASENKGIGDYLAVVVSYDKGSATYGAASRGWTTDTTYPEYRFAYNFKVNAARVVDHYEDGNPVISRNTLSQELTDLANTIVHEIFHVFTFDYNRPGATGKLYTDGALQEVSDKVKLPAWYLEGTASSVENSWQIRQAALKVLRTPMDGSTPLEDYDRDLLLERYINGLYHTSSSGKSVCDYCFDLECSGGTDRNDQPCETVSSRYVSGYFANLYLSELAARSSEIGSSIKTVDGKTVVDSSVLLKGMNSILERMHKGETLDQIINDISRDSEHPDGIFKDTDDFEAKFIKGTKDDSDCYTGESDSLGFVCDFVTYMNEIDKTAGITRDNLANGSILFDFEKDFTSSLDFDKTAETTVLKALDSSEDKLINFCRSTVPESKASSTGGKSLSGTTVASGSGTENSGNTTSYKDSAAEEAVSTGSTWQPEGDDDAANACEETSEAAKQAESEESAETAGTSDIAVADSLENSSADSLENSPADSLENSPADPSGNTEEGSPASAETDPSEE